MLVQPTFFIDLMFRICPLILLLLFITFGCAGTHNTPETAVRNFWTAMAKGDRDAVLKTQVYYEEGMTSEYILTPQNIEWLYLDSMVTQYDSKTSARVYYQVVFKKIKQDKATRYRTGTMTVKKNGKWMVGRLVGARSENSAVPSPSET